MIICRHFMGAATIAIAMLALACDSGTPSRTADEFAADSALAADLALANRDTLLVDSIGAYREPDAAEQDTALTATTAVPASGESVQTRAAVPAPQPARSTVTTPVQPAPSPAAAKASPAPKPPAPRLTGTRACRSPTPENQSECIRVSIAAADARLNRIYRALITEMRRQEGVPVGAKDPPSVQRLRVAQRAWLVYRDTECRRRGRGKEGALWARPRARCLGEFSARRANELADNFSRLTAN
jgi:uncharacterized protein YecT (DUF1311 family)